MAQKNVMQYFIFSIFYDATINSPSTLLISLVLPIFEKALRSESPTYADGDKNLEHFYIKISIS